MATTDNVGTTNTLDSVYDSTAFYIPNKLNADQYTVQDLDGGTEGVFGSGNMSYAGLQAAQTEALLANNNTGDFIEAALSNANNHISFSNPVGTGEPLYQSTPILQTPTAQHSHTEALAHTPGSESLTSASGQDHVTTTTHSLAASQLSSDGANIASGGGQLGLSSLLSEGNNSSHTQQTNAQSNHTQRVLNGQNGTSGMDGSNGTNGTNGQDGDGDACCDGGDVTINNTLIDLGLGDVITNINIALETIGDTILNLTTTITNVANILGDILTSITENAFTSIDTLLETISTITNNLLEEVSNIVTNITDVTQNITNLLQELLGGENGLGLDLNLLDTIGAQLQINTDNLLESNLDVSLPLEPVFELGETLGDLTGLDIIDGAMDSLGNVTTMLEGTTNDLIDAIMALPNGGELSEVTAALSDAVSGISNQLDDVLADALEPLGLGDNGLIEQLLALANETLDPVENVVDLALDAVSDPLATVETLLQDPTGAVEGLLADLPDVTDELGDILPAAGDVVNEALEGGVTEVVNDLAGSAGDLLSDLSNGASDSLTDPLEDTIEAVTDVVDNILDTSGLGGLGGALFGGMDTNDGGQDSDATANLGLFGANGTPLPLDVVLDPVEDIAGDIDLDLDVGLNLLDNSNTDNDAGDQDITLSLENDLIDTDFLGGDIDISLDPVEEIVGDIDLDLGAATNLLSTMADPLVNDGLGGTGEDTPLSTVDDTVSDVASSLAPELIGTNSDILANADILGGSDSDEATDTDLVINADIDLLGTELPDIELDIPLDAVEQVIGDIDLAIDTDLSLLDNSILTANSNDNDSDGGGNWTDAPLNVGNGLFSDVVSGIGGESDALPDPVGTVAEGLGALPTDDLGDIAPLGGLFG